MRHSFSFRGFVIGQQDKAEADVILSLLTKNRGKLLAQAKGLRKITSKRLGALQTGNLVKGQIHQKGDFLVLGDVELVKAPLKLRRDLVACGMVLTMSELINRLLPERQENESVYYLFEKTLKDLKKEVKPETMIDFEVELLKILGYGLPREIDQSLKDKDLKSAQGKLWQYLTQIAERKLIGLGKILG